MVKNAAQKQSSKARQRMSAATPMGLTPLTAKQRFFVEEYLIDLNATQAAIRAGYSKKTANRIATENLSKPVIATKIAELQADRARRVGVNADEVLEHLNATATSDIRDYLSFGPNGVTLKDSSLLTDKQARAIAKVKETVTRDGSTITFELHDKPKGIDMALKHLGKYAAEKREVSFAEEADQTIREAIQDIIKGVV